jgi:hypothetical protein
MIITIVNMKNYLLLRAVPDPSQLCPHFPLKLWVPGIGSSPSNLIIHPFTAVGPLGVFAPKFTVNESFPSYSWSVQ